MMSSYVSLAPSNLVQPPVCWTPPEVKAWLEFCVQEFALSHVCVDKFHMNGKALLLLTRTDFLDRAPQAGDILFNAFQHLRIQASNGYLKSPTFLSPALHSSADICSVKSQTGSITSSYIPLRPQPPTTVSSSTNYSPKVNSNTITSSAGGENSPGVPGCSPAQLSVIFQQHADSSQDLPKKKSPPHTSDNHMDCDDGTKHDSVCPPDDGSCRLLWEFLYQLLEDNKWSHVVCWEAADDFTFRILSPKELSDAWGKQKNRSNMTYEKLSRALRFLQHPSKIQKCQRGAKPHSSRTLTDNKADAESLTPDSSTFSSTSPTSSTPSTFPSTSPTSSSPSTFPSTSPTSSSPSTFPSTSPTSSSPSTFPSTSPISSSPSTFTSTSPISSSPSTFTSTSPISSSPSTFTSTSPISSSPSTFTSTSPISSSPNVGRQLSNEPTSTESIPVQRHMSAEPLEIRTSGSSDGQRISHPKFVSSSPDYQVFIRQQGPGHHHGETNIETFKATMNTDNVSQVMRSQSEIYFDDKQKCGSTERDINSRSHRSACSKDDSLSSYCQTSMDMSGKSVMIQNYSQSVPIASTTSGYGYIGSNHVSLSALSEQSTLPIHCDKSSEHKSVQDRMQKMNFHQCSPRLSPTRRQPYVPLSLRRWASFPSQVEKKSQKEIYFKPYMIPSPSYQDYSPPVPSDSTSRADDFYEQHHCCPSSLYYCQQDQLQHRNDLPFSNLYVADHARFDQVPQYVNKLNYNSEHTSFHEECQYIEKPCYVSHSVIQERHKQLQSEPEDLSMKSWLKDNRRYTSNISSQA